MFLHSICHNSDPYLSPLPSPQVPGHLPAAHTEVRQEYTASTAVPVQA